MRIGNGRDSLPSKMGVFYSFLLIIILLMYAGYKISLLEGRKSIDIVQAVKENHFDDTYVFTGEQGLNIAVAVFSTRDLSTHQPIDPSYGSISIRKINRRIEEGTVWKYESI